MAEPGRSFLTEACYSGLFLALGEGFKYAQQEAGKDKKGKQRTFVN